VGQITAAHTVRYWGLLHTHGGEREQREQVMSEVRLTRNAYHSASQGRAWLLPGGRRATEMRDIVAAFEELCSEQPENALAAWSRCTGRINNIPLSESPSGEKSYSNPP
jgi:hypothetical protein